MWFSHPGARTVKEHVGRTGPADRGREGRVLRDCRARHRHTSGGVLLSRGWFHPGRESGGVTQGTGVRDHPF